ncbi:hypothetical protein COLO4_02973 [Corchorus olitorius]|uniref:Uncharacterized protein n=1 Tax=Corchorus olitorius TaxID=93759 RepID=A0A1R3KZX1_9ROSI|nr:hypothetical protein COLO4_02973 [Corchorus olitorius]
MTPILMRLGWAGLLRDLREAEGEKVGALPGRRFGAQLMHF